MEYRFLDAEEVEARVDELNGRFEELVAELAPVEADETPSDQVSTGAATLIAI